jgi:hypothetical protein
VGCAEGGARGVLREGVEGRVSAGALRGGWRGRVDVGGAWNMTCKIITV